MLVLKPPHFLSNQVTAHAISRIASRKPDTVFHNSYGFILSVHLLTSRLRQSFKKRYTGQFAIKRCEPNHQIIWQSFQFNVDTPHTYIHEDDAGVSQRVIDNLFRFNRKIDINHYILTPCWLLSTLIVSVESNTVNSTRSIRLPSIRIYWKNDTTRCLTFLQDA